MNPSEVKTAVLLVAHGSRHSLQDDMLVGIVAEVRQLDAVDLVEVAYCGLQSPDIQTGIDRCVVADTNKIVLYPCFLLAGKHVHDLPAEIARAQDRHPGLEFQLEPPLGTDPALAGLVSASLKKSLSVSG